MTPREEMNRSRTPPAFNDPVERASFRCAIAAALLVAQVLRGANPASADPAACVRATDALLEALGEE